MLLAAVRQRVLELVIRRIEEAGCEEAAAAIKARDHGGQRRALAAAALLALVEQLTGALESDGVRALPVKGPVFANRCMGGAELREVSDLDLLVRTDCFSGALDTLADQGFVRADRGGSPLHATLAHPSGVAPVELHWRVHWLEDEFSAEMVDQAKPAPDGMLRATPAHELVTLLLLFARDGFLGVRLAADIAAWWDARGPELPPGSLDELLRRHPALATPARAAARVATEWVGLPGGLIGLGGWPRGAGLAYRLADLEGCSDAEQLTCNVRLVDILLSPGEGRREALLRAAALGAPPDDRGRYPQAVHLLKLGARSIRALWWLRQGGRLARPELTARRSH